MRSKADITQLNLYRTEPTTKSGKRRTKKIKKRMCSEVSVTVRGIRGVGPEEEKEGYSGMADRIRDDPRTIQFVMSDRISTPRGTQD